VAFGNSIDRHEADVVPVGAVFLIGIAEADEELHFACAFRLASGEPAGRRGPGGRIPEGESPGVMR